MNCNDFRKHVLELVDGRADSALSTKLEEHMKACPECSLEYELAKETSESLKKDAASIILPDKYKKGMKEVILKAPAKKYRNNSNTLKNIMYAAVIILCVLAGIYYSGGLKVAIAPSDNSEAVQDEVDRLKGENSRLTAEIQKLKNENEMLKKDNADLLISVNELRKESDICDWMMVNSGLNEALIEGTIVGIDREGKKIRLNIYKDDNTPDIDPNIIIPDGVYITRPDTSEKDKYTLEPGTIDDLKVGDHITLHYMGSTKSARAILF